jgi:hypothetical protein
MAHGGLQEKAALIHLQALNPTCDNSGSIPRCLPLEPLQKTRAAYAFWKAWTVMGLRNEFGARIAGVEDYRGPQKSSEIGGCRQSCRASADNCDLIPIVFTAGHPA